MIGYRGRGPVVAAMTTYQLQLARVSDGRTQLTREGSPAELGLDEERWPSPLMLDLEIDRNGDRMTIRGWIETVVPEDCARCLKSLESTLETEMTILADRAVTEEEAGYEPDMEDFLLHHDGRVLDLAPAIREQLVLTRPMLSLCRPDCKGLCPRCGVSWNEQSCDHVSAEASEAGSENLPTD